MEGKEEKESPPGHYSHGDRDLVRGLCEIRIPKFCLDNGKLFEQLQARSELQEAAPSWSILLRNLL